MRLLPIGITVFLWSFPAGLFVYWITSNLVTLVQNYVIYHHGPGRKSSGDKPQATNAQSAGASSRDGGASTQASATSGSQDSDSAEDATARAAKVAKRKRRKKKK